MTTPTDYSAALADLPPLPPQDTGPKVDYSAALADLPPMRPMVDTSGDEAQKALNLRWLVSDTTKGPEEQAETLRLASALKWKPEVVAADLAGARGAAEALKLDSLSVVRDHPILAGFIGDPNKTALARSDYDRLSFLERATGRDAVFADGKLEKAVPGWLARTLEGRRLNGSNKELEAQLYTPNIADPSLGKEWVYTGRGGGEFRDRTRPMTQADRDGVLAKIDTNDAELARLGQSGDAQFHERDYIRNALAGAGKLIIDMGPEMAVGGMLAPIPPLAALYWADEMRGGIHRELRTARKADGTPLLTDKEAADYSGASALFMGPIMAGLPGALGGAVGKGAMKAGAVEAAVGRVLPTAIDRLMVDQSFVRVVGKLATEYTEAQLHGGLIMGLQSGVSQATMELAQVTHGETPDHAIISAVARGAVQGMKDFAIISAFRPVLNTYSNYGRWAKSAQLADLAKSISTNMADSKTLKVASEEFGGLMSQMGPDTTFHLNLEALTELAQKEKVPVRELASRIMGDGGEAFDAATASGAALPIPIGKWAENVVKKGLHGELLPDTTLDPLVPTHREAAKERADTVERLKKGWEERVAGGAATELDTLHGQLLAAAKRIKKSTVEAETFAKKWVSVTSATAQMHDISVRDAIVKVNLPRLYLEEASGKVFSVLTGEERVAGAEPARAARERRAAASAAFDAHPAARAWDFLRGGAPAGSEALASGLRERAVASGAASAPAALLAEIAKVQKRVAKAEGGATVAVLERRSATKRVPVRVEADPEGGAAVRLHDGKAEPVSAELAKELGSMDPAMQKAVLAKRAAEGGGATHSVRVPSWLDAKDFAEHRAAWEHVWSALGGPDAPEHAQKLVYGFMRPSIEDGAAGPSKMGVMQAWAAGRLTQGLGGRGYAKVREALEKWAAEPEGTRAADPIDPKAWGGLLAKLKYDEKWVSSGKFTNKKKIEAFDRWLATTSGELDTTRADYATRPPEWYGTPDAVEPGAAKAASTEALRARLGELNAQAREAALAGAEVVPKVDFEAAVKILGKDVSKIPTEAGGILPDELASALGAPSGEALLRELVSRRDRSAWLKAETAKPTSLASEVAKELGVQPDLLPADLMSDAASKARVEVTTPETDATATGAAPRDAGLESFLEQASLEGVIVTEGDGSIHLRDPESKLWLWTEQNPDGEHLDISLLGVDAGPEGSPSWNAAVASERGKGYSSALYLKAIYTARLLGLAIRSDISRTDATERMYARLRDLGIPFEVTPQGNGIVDRFTLSAGAVQEVDVPAKWRELQARTKEKLGELHQANRGSIRMTVGPDGTPRDFIIRALAGDRSTLAHESAHFLSWSMHDMALEASAPEKLKADYAALLKFGGWKDAGARLADSLERSKLTAIPEAKRTGAESKRLNALEAGEERISHAWEQYLAEGKAPSAELKTVFSRFREWMGKIYGSIEGIKKQYHDNYGQELELSDEVRGVFDRLLAVDKSVEALRAEDAKVDFGNLLNLTPEDAAAIAELREKKYDEARDRLDRQTAESAGRAAGAGGHLNAEREMMRVEAGQQYDQSPGGVTEHFLLTGTLRGQEVEGKDARNPIDAGVALRDDQGRPLRLRYKDVVAVAGAAVADKLKARGLTRETGMHPDEVAGALGWADGAEMTTKMAEALPRSQAIEAEVKARMSETFGPELAQSTEALASAARRAAAGPADLLELLRERAALARELGETKARLPAGLVRDAVQQAISRSRVADLSPDFHLAAKDKAAKRAFDLMAQAKRASSNGRTEKSDYLYRQALHEWDEVILSTHLAEASEKLAAKVEDMRARVDRAGEKEWLASLGAADISYGDATKAIRLASGFAEGKADPAAIEQALAAMQRDGGEVFEKDGRLHAEGWDNDALSELARSPVAWAQLTVDEASNVHAAIVNLKATANGKNTVTLDGKKESKKFLLDKLEGAIGHLRIKGAPRDPGALSAPRRAWLATRRVLSVIDANLTEIEAIVDRVTGNDRNSPLWRLMIEERLRAADRELTMSKQFASRIDAIWSELPDGMEKRLRETAKGASEALRMPDTGGIVNPDSPMSLGQLIMVALNLGNEGNKQRLLDGYGWTEKQVMDELGKHLTKADLGWVQGVWTSLSDLYPHIEATHIADTGLRPEHVAATPVKFTLASGEVVELAGGYFPARYDPRVPSGRPVSLADASGVGALRTPFVRPARVSASHTEKRAEKNDDLLNLDFRIVPAHVTQVIHDVTHRLWVKEAAGVIMDPRFRTLLRAHMGPEYEAQFAAYVRAVATNGANSVAGDAMAPLNAILSWTKSKATLAAVGFNVSVPLTDLTNPLLPLMAGELSASHLAAVTTKLAANWPELRAFALEHSMTLRARAKHGNGLGLDMKEVMGAGWSHDIEQAAYWMMETSDRATATPVWLAKYYELMEGKTKEGDMDAHESAVRDADALVRRYFPATDAASKANWLRDRGALGQLTFLYGFANKVYNFNRRTITTASDAWHEPGAGPADKAQAIGRALFVLTAQAAVMGVAGDFLASRGPKKDETDAKGLAKWGATRMLATIPYQFPFVSLIAPTTARGGMPGSSLLMRLYAEGKHGATGKAGAVEIGLALGALAFGGAGLGQASKSGRYIDNGLSRDWRRGHYRSAASGLIFGQKASDQLVTPLNIGEAP